MCKDLSEKSLTNIVELPPPQAYMLKKKSGL